MKNPTKTTTIAAAAFVPCTLLSLACITCWCAAQATTPTAMRADRIVVDKSARTMTLMQGAKALKTYKVALSRKPLGAKEREGDHKVPEGEYVVDSKNAHSRFHLALHISYPNAADREKARKLGVRPGGNIEIHGLYSKHPSLGGPQRQLPCTHACTPVHHPEI